MKAGIYSCCLALLLGCSLRPPYQAPNRVIEDAHSGGTVVAMGPDSRLLASAGWEGWIRVWRLEDGSALKSWPAHDGEVTAVHFLSRQVGLLSAGYDGHLIMWDRDGNRLGSVATGSPIGDMVVDEAVGRVITGHRDGGIRFWRLSDLAPSNEFPAHSGPVRALAWHVSTRTLASSGRDGRVRVWSDTGASPSLASPGTDARVLAFSEDGRHLLGAGWFKVYRWDLATGRLQSLPTDHLGIINAITFTREGNLASISRQTDSAVLVIDPLTGATLKRLQPHALCGADVAVSGDGRYLATTSDDASVKIWDLKQTRADKQ